VCLVCGSQFGLSPAGEGIDPGKQAAIPTESEPRNDRTILSTPGAPLDEAVAPSGFDKTHISAPGERTVISTPDSEHWSTAGAGGVAPVSGAFTPGLLVAGRYEIVKVLGEGGMGAVYKAIDRELDRTVALKVIRPELARQPQILERFKQELILARQVTHRNVTRIYDLGSADGVKFITMEYFEGRDLSSLMEERRFTPEEAVKVMRQVCAALEAAHHERVIHRDLKTQNIMVDDRGKVCVMDFGLARSADLNGMTQAGTVMGTPTYMSPEQAKGIPADHRSDIFSLGIIFYEMLTGTVPFMAETLLGMLLKRTQEPATPPKDVDPTVPEALNNIILKALSIDPEQRYQSVTEMLADINGWAEGRAGLTIVIPTYTTVSPTVAPPPTRRSMWKWMAGAGGLAAAGGVNYLLWERSRWTASSKHTPVLLLVGDFENTTGDPVFNGTLEQIFATGLEGASFINAFNRGEARRLAAQIQAGASKLDETVARLVARREAINYIAAGLIEGLSQGYKLAIRVIEATSGKVVYSDSAEIPNKDLVTKAVNKLGAGARKALGDDTEVSLQLAAAESYTAASLEAANEYAQGQELLWAGKWDDAATKYQKAIEIDPNFGRAYASLAAVNANKGDRAAAESYYKQAMEHIDRMSDREKYRSRGVYYLMMRNHTKAIEEFTALLKQYPGDTAGLSNLAMAYHFKRDMAAAMKEGRRAIELYPNYLLPKHNLATYARYAGDFATAEKEERAVLRVNPAYLMAHTGLALSQLARGVPDQAADSYRAMEKISPRAASYCAMGLADIALVAGRAKAAAGALEKAAAVDLENQGPGAASKKLAVLAWVRAGSGQSAQAADAASKALENGKSEMVRLTVALALVEAGQEARARALVAEFGSRLEPDPQSYAKLIEGEIELKRGKAAAAVKLFSDAQQLADTWLARFARGRAYLEAGAFTEAYAELDLCAKRHGEATEVFLDDVPTYHLAPPVHYYLGRAQEGLRSAGAADSYRKFLSIRGKGDADPMVVDARRRLAKLG
jgi:tetratricopeptide (TPR) repeat protein/predicted Ser/Thr protein kinase